MERVFDDANDKNVAAYVVYGKASDSKLYDSTANDAKQITQEELANFFAKGRLIVKVSTASYVVVKVVANKAYTVDLVSGAVSVTEWSAKAAE
jgi:hypothetical protein